MTKLLTFSLFISFLSIFQYIISSSTQFNRKCASEYLPRPKLIQSSSKKFKKYKLKNSPFTSSKQYKKKINLKNDQMINLVTSNYSNISNNSISQHNLNNSKFPNKHRHFRSLESFTTLTFFVDNTTILSQDNPLTPIILRILNDSFFVLGKLLDVANEDPVVLTEEDITQKCGIQNFNTKLLKGVTEDIVIFPYYAELPGNAKAAASFCVQEENEEKAYKRPIAGYIQINPNININMRNAYTYLKNLFIHELMHILLFHPDLIQSFVENTDIITKTVNGIPRKLINTMSVNDIAKKHFGCPSISGIEMENNENKDYSESTIGFHWESRIMLGDIMIGFDYAETVISEITLAFFEDSGWYLPKPYTGGLFRYGKLQGCNFLEDKCINNDEKANFKPEFCDIAQQPKCSVGRLSAGFCYLGTLSKEVPEEYRYFTDNKRGGSDFVDYCPIAWAQVYSEDNGYYYRSCTVGWNSNYYPPQLGFSTGSSSICMVSSLVPISALNDIPDYASIFRAMCYIISCDFDKKEIIVHINNQQFICPTEGGKLTDPTGFSGTVNCPDFYSVCSAIDEFCNSIDKCAEKELEVSEDSYSPGYTKGEEMEIPAPKIKKRYERAENLKININLIMIWITMIIVMIF